VRSKKGFTLVELLVVIAIVAVLMGVLIVAIRNVKGTGKRLQCGVRLSGIGKAFSMYMADYDPYLPTLEDYPWHAIQHYYTYKRNEYPGKTGTFWCGLGCLYSHGLIDSALTFYCPATQGWEDDYATGLGPNRIWGGAAGFLKVRLGYVYWPLSKEFYSNNAEWQKLCAEQNQDAVNYLAGYPKSPEKQPVLDRNKAIACDYTFHEVKGSGWNLNALFADGHVVFQGQPRDSDGKAMVHTDGQFGNLPGGDSKGVPIVKFMYGLQP
jgi:prepilin-type N-terminal cleavage/methylation domain-containing protein/prepilin-type processing-associated H-X9-DG protein